MSLVLSSPEKTFAQIVTFLRHTFVQTHKNTAVVAVSGGIDSALSLSCLVHALGKDNVIAVLLPYAHQDMADARSITEFHHLPTEHVLEINIQPIVDTAAKYLGIDSGEALRLGNLKARARMLCVFDQAKKYDGLVCGTENKSEHYLGYFTRFGDAASDIEPIANLYKTQVRQVVQYLQLPEVFLEKAPSAGLWVGQTDEEEMGFTYEQADKVLEQLIDLKLPAEKIQLEDVPVEVVQKVVQQVQNMAFKLQVPYIMGEK